MPVDERPSSLPSERGSSSRTQRIIRAADGTLLDLRDAAVRDLGVPLVDDPRPMGFRTVRKDENDPRPMGLQTVRKIRGKDGKVYELTGANWGKVDTTASSSSSASTTDESARVQTSMERLRERRSHVPRGLRTTYFVRGPDGTMIDMLAMRLGESNSSVAEVAEEVAEVERAPDAARGAKAKSADEDPSLGSTASIPSVLSFRRAQHGRRKMEAAEAVEYVTDLEFKHYVAHVRPASVSEDKWAFPLETVVGQWVDSVFAFDDLGALVSASLAASRSSSARSSSRTKATSSSAAATALMMATTEVRDRLIQDLTVLAGAVVEQIQRSFLRALVADEAMLWLHSEARSKDVTLRVADAAVLAAEVEASSGYFGLSTDRARDLFVFAISQGESLSVFASAPSAAFLDWLRAVDLSFHFPDPSAGHLHPHWKKDDPSRVNLARLLDTTVFGHAHWEKQIVRLVGKSRKLQPIPQRPVSRIWAAQMAEVLQTLVDVFKAALELDRERAAHKGPMALWDSIRSTLIDAALLP